MCYSVQTLSGRTPLHQKSSDFFFGAANIRIFPFSAKLFPPCLRGGFGRGQRGRLRTNILKHHPPSPEDCKSDKALPRGEGLGGGNVDQYIGASSAKRMMLQYMTLPSGTVNMSVDFRSKNALVPKHLLHSPQISPILDKMRGE